MDIKRLKPHLILTFSLQKTFKNTEDSVFEIVLFS